MPALLALLSSLLLGGADFFGGLAARRAPAAVVVVWSNAVGLLSAVLVIVVLPSPMTPADLGWGLLSGTFGSVGAALLYRALALGSMSLVAPATAAAAAVVPVVAAAAMGERLTVPATVGLAGALVSVVLISGGRSAARLTGDDVRGLGLAVLAGVSFGGFLVMLAQTSADSGLGPLVAARCASLLILVTLVRSRRQSLLLPRGAVRLSLAAGLLDMAANVLFLVAVRLGHLAVVGLLASLSPLGTVLLARVLLNERLRGPQRVGTALAVGSIAVLSLR
jgi:drug/metabolite transporter (DMT)-like permease